MSYKGQVTAVDLTQYPDLTVVYLGMKVTRLRGIRTVLGLGRPLAALDRDKLDGLLHQELFLWRLDHVGIRQYWRDFEALEQFTRSAPHNGWWAAFLRDPKGTGFWHETYRKSGGMEGIYLGLPDTVGFARFAPNRPREGDYARARQRLAA
ncbi:monooxygenase family protein [Rhodopila sp.]|uniref:monooxygenase family protein n=1 Tax=Rhodopila sp. TaxID=2480087 RepID=UPI003D143522